MVLKCSIPSGSTGNVQSNLIDAETGVIGGSGGDVINTGNQTIPLQKVQEFFSAKADISVIKTANPVCFGKNISYSITIKNNETSTFANGIVATDVLDANQTFVSASGAYNTQSGQTTTFNVGALAPQQSVTLTLMATPNIPGSVDNTVSITEITDDPDLSNNTSSTTTTVYELPACSITGGVETITAGGSTNWCAAAGMSSYSWSGPNGFTSTEQCVDVSDEGEYSVTVTNANGCSSTCKRTLSTSPCSLTVSVNSGIICNGESITLTATDNGTNSTYLWSTGETTQSISVSPTSTTDYTVTVTDGATVCVKDGTGKVTVNDRPDKPTVTGGPTTFCTGGSVVLSSSAATGNQWYKDGVKIDGATDQTYTATESGVYSVTVTNDAGCSSTSDETTVKVNERPDKPTVTSGTTTFCTGGSVVLSSSAATGNQWYKDGVKIDGATDQTYTATASGVYTVTVTNDADCSSTSDGTTVKVNSTPAKPTVTSGSTTFCSGGSVVLSSSAATGNQWYKDGVKIDGATDQTYTATTSGVYTVIVTNGSGCSSTSDGTTVKVNDRPAKPAISSGATTFCTGGSVILSSSAATGNQWYKNGVEIDGATGQTYTATSAGVYTVVVTNDAGCTATSDGTTVTVNPNPSCTISGSASAVLGVAASFSAPSAPSGSTYGYAWSFVSNTSGATFTTATNLQTVSVNTTTTGSYKLSVTVTDKTYSTNCPSTCTYTVTVGPAGPYYTVTQGFYGNVGGKVTVPSCTIYTAGTSKSNVDGLIAASIKLMPGGKLTLGIAANNKTFIMGSTAAEDKNLITYMPAGQTAAVISADKATSLGNNTNMLNTCAACVPPTTQNLPKLFNKKISSVLLGQTITLALNKYIPGNTLGSFVLQTGYLTTQKADYTKCPIIKLIACSTTEPNAISSLQITTSAGLITWINSGKTVNDLLNLASNALGGAALPAGVTLSDINNAVDVINRSFDGGRYFLGYYPTAKSCSVPPAAKPAIVQTDPIVTELAVSTYPNPYTDKVKFSIVSPVSGKASLEVFNMMGQKVANVYQGYLYAGRGQVIDYNVPTAAKGSLIYTLKVGDKQVNGKVIHLK